MTDLEARLVTAPDDGVGPAVLLTVSGGRGAQASGARLCHLLQPHCKARKEFKRTRKWQASSMHWQRAKDL